MYLQALCNVVGRTAGAFCSEKMTSLDLFDTHFIVLDMAYEFGLGSTYSGSEGAERSPPGKKKFSFACFFVC